MKTFQPDDPKNFGWFSHFFCLSRLPDTSTPLSTEHGALSIEGCDWLWGGTEKERIKMCETVGVGLDDWDPDFCMEVQMYCDEVSTGTGTGTATAILHLQNLNPKPCVDVSASIHSPRHSTLRPPPPPPPPPNLEVYSPPRSLSQRSPKRAKTLDRKPPCNGTATAIASTTATGSNTALFPSLGGCLVSKEQEINELQLKLSGMNNQVQDLKQQCLNLKKERDNKEERLNSIFSQLSANRSACRSLKVRNLEFGFRAQGFPGSSMQYQNEKNLNEQIGSLNCSGVQAGKTGKSGHLTKTTYHFTSCAHPGNLVAIWGSPSAQISGRNLVSKLFAACPRDFHVLFGSLGASMSSDMALSSHVVKSSFSVAAKDIMSATNFSDAEKVSHLYFVLTKISNGMVPLETLIECLLDLCHVENTAIVCGSLRIFHEVLNYILTLEGMSEKRDCIKVEGIWSSSHALNFFGSERTGIQGQSCVNRHETLHSGDEPVGKRLFRPNMLSSRVSWDHRTATSPHHVNWVAIFEAMCQIPQKSTNENVKLEAVSIMNVILLRTSAYMEREKFGRAVVFGSVSQMLMKESGSNVQKQAVYLLYLLLNCPKLLVTFLSGCEVVNCDNAGTTNNESTNISGEFSVILDGLADCLTCHGSNIQDLKLRRNVVNVLAFLASSGKPGFEVLFDQRISRKTNFLASILEVLVSEIDIEAAQSNMPLEAEISRERTLLIREALIFLNRLVSNPAYSTAVLRVLSSNPGLATLVVDIANRLCRTSQKHSQDDSTIRQMRESEIVDLARVFKKRVFTYFGASIP